MKQFEIDVLVCQPTTVRVAALTEDDARQLALDGKGVNISGVEFTYGEVVDVRNVTVTP